MAEIRLKSTGTIKLFENDNTSSVTIASPASLGGDRTITLPDASVTLASGTMNDATNLSGTVPIANGGTGSTSTTYASLTANVSGTLPVANGGTALTSGFVNGGALTEVDMWRLIADFTQDAVPITSNFERCDTGSFAKIGTGMSHSAGVFTFGATGVYQVTWHSQHRRNGENPSLSSGFDVSANSGVAWTTVANCYPTLQEYTTTVYSSGTCHGIVNVDDESVFRIRAYVNGATDVYTNGATDYNRTYFVFVRLGAAQ